MEKFTTLTGIAAPLDKANIDTDQIIPGPFLKRPRSESYEGILFYRVRRNADGSLRDDFILNKPPYDKARIFVANRNFGCGSSREGAAWALVAAGVRTVIAPSFGDIHYNNEMNNGMVPVILPEAVCDTLRAQLHASPGAEMTVDLETQTVTAPDGTTYDFTIPAFNRYRLLNGLDEIDVTLESDAAISAFEAKRRQEADWLFP
jgi:3-isopropylmalate/(R)-2-methylmalate dehydratase small subunit